ncbi:hypothetical protein SCHPADRAFT_859434 [Schizopora paradoxa]|uniref:Phosphatidylglycerol/phosphatidylinositol transfer protein n=1 Tax=Schizopora paradoxa TaxID=27342 RepID=A0A0H2R9K4_9AGAM|nr:hypothetical protein SCHPADRAFT_859434 [Schizopora paradoxa]
MHLATITVLFVALAASGAFASVLQANRVLDSIEPIPSTSWSYKDCGDETFGVKVTSIELSPDPPQKGQELNVTVSGIVRTVIEDDAYALVKVKMGFIEVLNKEYDVCKEARDSDSDVQCPVEKGVYSITQTAMLPSFIPPQTYIVTVDAFSRDDDPLICVSIQVEDFKKRFTFLPNFIF